MTQAICDITTDEVNVDVVVEPQADTMVEVANRAGGMEQVFHDNTLIGNGNSVDLGVNTEIIATKEYVDEKVESIDTYTKDQIDGKLTAVDAQIDANADAIQKTREDYINADSEIHQILNNHAENLTTLHNDVDDLGDQVAEIESKIPESASATNQLATKADLKDIDLDGYVKKSGDTMTGDLVFDVVAGGYTVAFQDSYANADTGNTDSVIKRIQSNHSVQGLIFSETKNGTVNMQFTMIADGFFMPHGNRLLGSADYPWENIYAKKLNNGSDLVVPTSGGTLARVEDLIDLRADINQVDSELQTQITAQAAEIATKAEKDSVYTKEQVDAKVSSVYKVKGSVANYDSLPTDANVGDVYNVLDTGINYVWTTDGWDALGGAVDLTDYAKKTYVDSADQQLKTNQDSLYTNQVVLRDMLNAKDADGNWTTLTTTAQAAIPAINELNENKASKEDLSGYLPLSGGELTGPLSLSSASDDWTFEFRRESKYVAFVPYYQGRSYSHRWLFDGNRILCKNDEGYNTNFFIGSSDAPLFELWTQYIGAKGGQSIIVPTEGGTLARKEDIDAIGGDGTAGQVLTKTEDGMAWQDAAGGGASLPDQTGNAGKFLQTDGTTASWGASYAKSDYVAWADATYHKINIGTADAYTGGVSATAAYVAIGAKNCGAGCVAILGSALYSSSVAIGNNSIAEYNSTAIGNYAQARGGTSTQGTIAIGYGAKTGSVKCAIQLGGNGAFDGYTNSDANTFKVGNANGNFEMMSADGTIPAERMSATAGTTGQVLTKTDTGMAWADAAGGDGDIDCGVMS